MIVIKFNTNTETERILFKTKYLVQTNFTFDLTILSNGFSGNSHFCVNIDQLEKMCIDLKRMHLTLFGKTIFNDNDSDGFVKFEIEPNGQLIVSGRVGGTTEDHFMRFAFCTD
jgi:hypothetical protein